MSKISAPHWLFAPPPVRPTPQIRQSAKLFLQSLELGLPQPLTHTRVSPPPLTLWFRGEGHTHWRERAVRESQFQRGDIHCGTLDMYVICAPPPLPPCNQAPSTSTLSGCTSYPHQRWHASALSATPPSPLPPCWPSWRVGGAAVGVARPTAPSGSCPYRRFSTTTRS